VVKGLIPHSREQWQKWLKSGERKLALEDWNRVVIRRTNAVLTDLPDRKDIYRETPLTHIQAAQYEI
jgi:hypothetical protein